MEAKILASINRKDDEIHIEDILNRSDDSDIESESSKHAGGMSSGFPGAASVSGPQTGPKGVLNDYKQHKLNEWKQKQENKKKVLEKAKKNAMLLTLEQSDDDLDNLLEDDVNDEFMRSYTMKRMNDMRVSSNERKIFGFYKRITAETYSAEIDSEPPGTIIIVHIYKSSTSLLHRHLQDLSKDYGYVKFLHLPSTEAPHLDAIALPAILAYKDGDLKETILQFTEPLTSVNPITGLEYDYTMEQVERLLGSHNILKESDYCKC